MSSGLLLNCLSALAGSLPGADRPYPLLEGIPEGDEEGSDYLPVHTADASLRVYLLKR